MPPKKKGGKKRKAVEEKYKLIYFDIEGLAETSRLLFAAAQHEYEDKRYSQETKDGKTVRPEFEADKKNFPFGQVPILEFEDTKIAQSRAIENFLAKKLGFYGKGPLDAAQIEAVVEQFRDLTRGWRDHKEKGDEEVKKFFSTYLPQQFEYLEKLLKDNKSGYFVGKKATLADIAAYRHLHSYWAPDYKTQLSDVLKNFPLLEKLHDTVDKIEGIKEYHDKKNQPKEAKPNPPADTQTPVQTPSS